MFLAHSRREAELARIYGITNEAGISLVSPDYPYHYLVEQEERWHGAILGNTTHGMLFCSLGSMSCQPHGGLLYRPGIVASGPALPPLQAYNHIGFCRGMMFDGSRMANEGFAKYLAFLAQTSLIGDFSSDLIALFEADCQRYPLLNALSDFLGPPFSSTEDNYNFKKLTVYTLSKLVFNTNELEKLYRLDELDAFREEFLREKFWNNSSPNSRSVAIMDTFSPTLFRTLKANYEKDFDYVKTLRDIEAPLPTPYCRYVYKIFSKHLKRRNYGIESPKKFVELAERALVVGKRIEYAFPGIFTHLDPHPFKLGCSREGKVTAEIITTNGPSHSAIFNYDPAFRVMYEVNHDLKKKWEKIASSEDLKLRISKLSGISSAVIYVALSDDDKFDLSILSETETSLIVPWTVPARSSFLCIRISVDKVAEVRKIFSLFPQEKLAIVVLKPPVEGLTDYKLGFRHLLSNFGTLVFWEILGTLSSVGQRFTYFYHTSRIVDEIHRIANTAPFVESPSTPVGMISVDEDSGYGTVCCTPAYFFGMSGIDVSQQGVGLVIDDPGAVGQVSCATGFPDLQCEKIVGMCATVFRLYFEYGVLPEVLPVYDPKALLYALSDDGWGDDEIGEP